MIPVHCRVTHDPSTGRYGDCLRACIASVMEMNAEDVPHFAHDGATGDVMFARAREWLKTQGLTLWLTGFPGSVSAHYIREHQRDENPDAHYLLFGRLDDGSGHVVVCKGVDVAHDPSWTRGPLVMSTTDELWIIGTLVKL